MQVFLTLVFLLGVFTLQSHAQQNEITADNGIIRVRLDLTRGGAISYISLSGNDRNLINIHDEGRYIQQSYYAGKSLDRKHEGQSPGWSPWPWNPIQVGDTFGNRAKIIDHRQYGDTLYVKCTPMQWDMNNKPAEAVMEQWTILRGNVLEVHNKITCFRTDTIYGDGFIRDQELPAVYPISSLKNLYCYMGKRPFSHDSLSLLPVVKLSSGFWGRYDNVSEHWMAFVDNNEFGIGVYNPQCHRFLAGLSGDAGEEATDASTCYIAPVSKVALSKNAVFSYNYFIILGAIDDIRKQIYELHNN